MTDPTPTPDLDAIRARVQAQPFKEGWLVDSCAEYVLSRGEAGGDVVVCEIRGWGWLTGRGRGGPVLSGEEALDAQRATGEFIAHARQDIPALLDLVERQQREMDVLKKDVEAHEARTGVQRICAEAAEARCRELEAELATIDARLARRPALEWFDTRAAKVEHACAIAGDAEVEATRRMTLEQRLAESVAPEELRQWKDAHATLQAQHAALREALTTVIGAAEAIDDYYLAESWRDNYALDISEAKAALAREGE